ncbi:MAG TPA: DUF302 domain-containing protein [Caulobacteraceae bacterium]|nr:DUF302 domain-containing protein [Caulobacteraceae bacterium]
MTYYFAKTLHAGFDEAVARTREALAREGFGVVSEIDVAKTMKSKLGVDFRPYLILGACNPMIAHEALKIEDKIGTMLPCNVVVHEPTPGRSEVAAIDPVASMQAIGNPELLTLARQVADKLRAIVASL